MAFNCQKTPENQWFLAALLEDVAEKWVCVADSVAEIFFS